MASLARLFKAPIPGHIYEKDVLGLNPHAFKGLLAYQFKFLHLDACQDAVNDLELRAGLETRVFFFSKCLPQDCPCMRMQWPMSAVRILCRLNKLWNSKVNRGLIAEWCLRGSFKVLRAFPENNNQSQLVNPTMRWGNIPLWVDTVRDIISFFFLGRRSSNSVAIGT